MSRSWWSAVRVVRLAEADEVGGHEPGALVEELEEGVLAVRARLAPHDGPGVPADRLAATGHGLAVALHVELLEVGGEAGQLLAVGEDGVGLGAEEVRVPDAEQAEEHRQVVLDRRGAEVLVDQRGSRRAAPGSGSARCRSSPRARWPSRASSARRPSPRSRTCSRVSMPNAATSSALVDTATKWCCDGVLAEGIDQPGAGGAGVGHRLEGREGLRRDDEQGLGRIEAAAASCGCRRRRRSRRSAARCHRRRRRRGRSPAMAGPRSEPPIPMLTTLVSCLPVAPVPGAGAHVVGEPAHAVEHLVDLGDDVVALVGDHRALGCSQRDVEHGPVLGDVDVLAGEHRIPELLDAGGAGEVGEQRDRVPGDPVLRPVDVEVARPRRRAPRPDSGRRRRGAEVGVRRAWRGARRGRPTRRCGRSVWT